MLATAADLSARLGLAKYTAIYNGDVTLANAHLSAASAEVVSHIGLRYKMPPETLQTCEIAKQYTLTLCEELAWGSVGTATLPEDVKRRVDEVRKLLSKIASGDLGFADGTESDQSTGGASLMQCDDPLFTTEKLAGF